MSRKKRNAKWQLTDRDRRMLQFVVRYRIGTVSLFANTFFEGLHRVTNAGRVTRKLVRRGLLTQVHYSGDISYFVLTRRGSKMIGAPDRRPRPLTEHSLPAVLGIAAYCVRTGIDRMTDKEFRERYPELWRPGLRSSAYFLVDTPEGMKLGMFLIDRGGTARRLKSKIRRFVDQRRSLPAFASLMKSGRFRVTVLTGLPAQHRNILRRISQLRIRGAEVEAALVPELGELLTAR